MFDRGKYIVGEIESSTGFDIATAVCFSEAVEHSSVAKLFTVIWSAGFFNVGCDELGIINVAAYGKSISLGVESQFEKDEKFIKRALGLDI